MASLPLVCTLGALIAISAAGVGSLPLDAVVLTAAVLGCCHGSVPFPAAVAGEGRMKALLRRLSRYAAVSAISTTVTLSLLGLFVYTKTLSPGWANVVATAAGHGAVVRAEPALGLG